MQKKSLNKLQKHTMCWLMIRKENNMIWEDF